MDDDYEGSPMWANDILMDLMEGGPQEALQMIVMILERDLSKKRFEMLAAGPLEDLLKSSGEVVIDQIEKEATQNPKFATLLGGVWKSEIKDEVWNRVQKARDQNGWD